MPPLCPGIYWLKQSSKQWGTALNWNANIRLVEQALLPLVAKFVQSARLCFQCSHLHMDQILPESVVEYL